jgi:hypothetical protein
MLQNIVTVTFKDDFKYLLLQAESIKKYLSSDVPFTHWVIINDSDINDITPYELELKKYYDNTMCELKIFQQPFFENKFITKSLDGDRNIYELSGSYSQQICKLEIAKLIKNDYLVLDSKNFFIRPVSLQFWEKRIGCGEYIDVKINYFWKKCVEEYCEKINMTVPDYVCNPATPFKIKMYDDMLNADFKSLIENSYAYSEFIIYWMKYVKEFQRPANKDFVCFYTFFYLNAENKYSSTDPSKLLAHKIPLIDNDNEIRVSGFHREFIKLCEPKDIVIINEWLGKKEIEFRF